jgi:hypothetical protein
MPIFSRREIEALLALCMEVSRQESKRFRKSDTSNAVFGCTAGVAPRPLCLKDGAAISVIAMPSAAFDARNDQSRLGPIGSARSQSALQRTRIFWR